MRDTRYLKNGIFSDEDQVTLKSKKVAVIGCGGLGGYIIEMLARLGVGNLVICDGDAFDESNLNRQLLAKEDNVGARKVREAAKRIAEVNSSVNVTVRDEKLTNQNGRNIIYGCDLVIDALDTPRDKILLEGLCAELDIPLIHGAISGWFGQVAVIFPGDDVLYNYYKEQGSEDEPYGNPAFTPALVASLQVSEAVKLLLNTGDHMSGVMTLIDLYYNETETIEVY
ncbi:MAG: HesA/MoeB/ThiF family protein [Firmicutes bacterium]|nr:HesA/MoeB/ThiF family protein [Bacillota bacterium]